MNEIQQYLNHLGSPYDNFLFCAIKENRVRTLYGKYDAYYHLLQGLNDDGYGIHLCINKTLGSKRTKKDIKAIRAIWQEDDGNGKEFPLKPTMVVQSSKGKFHRYWRVHESTDFSLFSQIMEVMVIKYGSDTNAKDICRVLKIPGFYNPKYSPPFLVNIEEINDKIYSLEDFREFLPNVPNVDKPGRQHKSVEDILTSENYNGSLCKLSMSLLNYGMSKSDVEKVCKGIMQNVENKDERWHERYEHIERLVSDGAKKVDSEDAQPITVKDIKTVKHGGYPKFKRPPGMLGDVLDSVHQSMRYPSVEIATVTALHTVASFIGRQTSFNDLTATSRRVLLAKQGRGKDTASKYVSAVVQSLMLYDSPHFPRLPQASNFQGAGDYTNMRTLHQELTEFASRSLIISEAGQASKSLVGDRAGLKAYILQLIAKGKSSMLIPRGYAKNPANENLKPLFEINAIFLHESVPTPYLEVMQSDTAFESGEFARNEIVLVNPYIDMNNINYDATINLSEEIVHFFYVLANRCLQKGNQGHEKVNPVEELIAECDASVIKYLHELEFDVVKGRNDSVSNIIDAILARKIQKLSVICLILAAADSVDINNPSNVNLRITREHVEWGLHYLTEIEESLFNHLERGLLSGKLESTCTKILLQISTIFSTPYTMLSAPIQTSLNVTMWQQKVCSVKTFAMELGKLDEFTNFSNNACRGNTTAARDIVIKELEDSGRISKIRKEKALNKYGLNMTCFKIKEIYE